MKRKLGILFSILLVVAIIITGCDIGTVKKEEKVRDMSKVHHVKMEIEHYGTVEIELDGNEAPITVDNFMKLVNEKYYDGLTFHRNMEGFMAQGGYGTLKGKPAAATIKGEFKNNGVNNTIKHTRGTISMARVGGMNDSASSQFFIVQQAAPHLDGDYAAFGHVTSGMEAIDNLLANTPVQDDNGTTLPKDQPVIISIRAID